MSLYDDIGGMEGCRKLAESFYGRVHKEKALAPLFPGSLHCAIAGLTAFLAEFLGGPLEYSHHRWHLSLREAHGGFAIGPKERTAWLRQMRAALHDASMPEELRRGLAEYFEDSSRWIAGITPSGACPHAELDRRWKRQHALERAIAAARAGLPDAAIELAEGGTLEIPTLVSLLALLQPHPYCIERVRREPSLAVARHARRRTLLHDACAAGNLPLVEALLALGADVHASSSGGHMPLYTLANECRAPLAPEIARRLVAAGADSAATMGVERSTALHMAARRGNTALAAALVESGAPLDARDRKGDTPLQRALNCRQKAVALFLAKIDGRHPSHSPILR